MQFAHETERRLIQKIYGRTAPRVMVTMTIHSLSLQQETHKVAHRRTCSIRSSRMTGKPEVELRRAKPGPKSAYGKRFRLTFQQSAARTWSAPGLPFIKKECASDVSFHIKPQAVILNFPPQASGHGRAAKI
jgi:hypothetical protein